MKIKLIIFTVLSLLVSKAFACDGTYSFGLLDIKESRVIFRGSIVEYTYVSRGIFRELGREKTHLKQKDVVYSNIAHAKFRVLKTYKGILSGDFLDIYWDSANNSGPVNNLEEFLKIYGNETIIGVVKYEDNILNSSPPGLIIIKADFPNIGDLNKTLWVNQHVCGRPFIFSVQNTKIREILKKHNIVD